MSIRLIDTTTLRMRVFPGEKIPRYAILSHTWVGEQEVSFLEMSKLPHDPDHPAAQKSGYRKILKTCQIAKSHQLNYAWIDTCCIDKSSSAELSEAINSMFLWYQRAQVCYAFLEDLPPGADMGVCLPRCRWFERGWCLQELLAPQDLRIFNKNWENVGSKNTDRVLISAITGIDEAVLRDNRLLPTIPVARRMSWAAKRVTTRIEDIAYCLLGIFDVNMPMLYGEGSKAFLRLQEEIIKRSSDLSIFFKRAPDPSYSRFLKQHVRSYDLDESQDRETNSSRDHNTREPFYKDLFATSPTEFSHCGQLAHVKNGVGFGPSFALTNNGLHFTNVSLVVHERTSFEWAATAPYLLGSYYLPLDCRTLDSTECCRLMLHKIGPSRFVSIGTMSDEDYFTANDDEKQYFRNEEVSILTNITPMTEALLRESSAAAIQFLSSGTPSLSDALQSPNPVARWDCPNLRFLTYGEESFEASLKVVPDLAAIEVGGVRHGSEHFYLACAFESDRGRSITPWVMLLTTKDWKHLHKNIGDMVRLNGEGRKLIYGRKRNKLELGLTRVAAEISNDKHPNLIEIQLNWG
jgi:hypothetical protein